MSGAVSVPTYPTSNRVPGVFSVVDATQANTGQVIQRSLIIGQMTGSGMATAGQPLLSAGIGDAQVQFGAGSQLAVMVERYRALDGFGELWCLPLADAAGSVASVSTITFTGPATVAGTLPLYLDGHPVPVAVSVGDTATVVAANVATAVNAWTSPGGNPLTITATAASGVVTLTARNKGTLGNSLDIRFAYYGSANGEVQPAALGLTATIAASTPGTIDPTIATALANLPATGYDFIALPYTDTTNLNAMQAFLGDAAGRWNWSQELFGHAFSGFNGTFATRSTFGQSRNDQHATVGGLYGTPNPAWHWAAELTAVAAVSLRANPALPVGGLGGGMALNVLPPPIAQRDTFTERNTLLYDGFSTFVVDASGVVRVQRLVTTYQTNAGGAPDDSYLDVNVPFCIEAWITARRTMIQSKFNQSILVADGSRIPPGSQMVTAQTIKVEIIALYRQLALTGVVQNPAQFAQNLVATNAGNGLVTLLEPIQLGNQLYQVAADVQFTRP